MLLPFLALASAAPLRLDPARPPTAQADGRYDFGGTILEVSDGFILHLEGPGPAGARWLGGPFWRVPSTDPVGEALAWVGQPGVVSAFPDVVLPFVRRFDDPSYGGQWYLESLGMEELYAVSLGSSETRIAVIDSGIDILHPDLVDAVVAPYDAWSDDADPSPDPGEYCSAGSDICDGHGTAVSGIVAARADNGVGIVGMCPACSLVPIKLLGEGRGTASAEIAAFEWAIAQDVAVINNSWGFADAIAVPEPLAEVIRRAATVPREGRGALVVFAAGNEDREIEADEVEAMEEVLCITGTDTYGYPVNYTNHGASVDVAAPSATVSLAPGGEVTTTFGGTSGAAPVAAGLAAWAASVQDLDAVELHALLVDSATPSPYIPETDHDDYYGYGNLSAAGVMAALFPPEAKKENDEEPATSCGCASASGTPAWSVFLLVFLRRR